MSEVVLPLLAMMEIGTVDAQSVAPAKGRASPTGVTRAQKTESVPSAATAALNILKIAPLYFLDGFIVLTVIVVSPSCSWLINNGDVCNFILLYRVRKAVCVLTLVRAMFTV